MDKQKQLAWLKLAQLTLRREAKQQLLDQYTEPEAVFEAGYANWKKFVRLTRPPQWPADEQLLRQQALLDTYQIQILPLSDPRYPTQLAVIADAPIALFVRGDISLLSRPQLAIIGSRSASPAGLKTAEAFAKGISQAGVTITSGLALGIDAAAHRGAMAGVGDTVAVVATGLDQVYPRQHVDLMTDILQQGTVVSEFAPLSPPRREAFPQRNRLISGLSLGVLVVEAGTRSGSLITARLAGEQGRDIFAIPGSIHNPTSRGCHQLIRQGAKLVETTHDVLEELKPALDAALPAPATNGTAAPDDDASKSNQAETFTHTHAARILSLIDHAPTGIDELHQQSTLPIEEISSILLQLELDGRIASCGAGQYQRLPG